MLDRIMFVLETPRLLIREMAIDDFDALHAVYSDAVAMVHYPEPFDATRTKAWIERNVRNYSEHGFGLWALVHKEEDKVVGDCGLSLQQVGGDAELEIGYRILRSHWNQGLATEAASACRDYVFDELRRDRVISWMRPENIASRRVAEKIGMRLEKEAFDRTGKKQVVYSMTPRDRTP